jgi:hypothetical protein
MERVANDESNLASIYPRRGPQLQKRHQEQKEQGEDLLVFDFQQQIFRLNE